MSLLKQLEKNKNTWIILFVLIFFFLLRLPSLFEPYWYGDEGVYQVVGMAIKDNRLLYRDIWDNKPPLIYMLYSAFNSEQFGVRTASLIFGLLSVFIFFILSQKIFHDSKDSRIPIFTTIVFTVFFGLPFIEGNIANAENFMILPILLSAFLIFSLFQAKFMYGIDKINPRSSRGQKSKIVNLQLITAGLLLGIAFLLKVVAVFDLLAFLVFIIAITNLPQKLKIAHIKRLLRQTILFPIGFFFPIILTVLFFILKGGFKDFLQAVFLQNIGYPQGPIILKLILLLAFVFYIFKIRKRLSKRSIFILVWFAFSLFNAFFAGRPYSHYLLVLAPAFSLTLGLMLSDQKYRKTIAILLILTTLLVFKNFYFFSKPISYYQNFVDFITDKKSVKAYRAFFGRQTLSDYETASFLKSRINHNDSIFVWGDNPHLYKMVGVVPHTKYIAAYHIAYHPKGIANTVEALEKAQPRFIVITSNPESLPFSLSNYSAGIRINGAVIYERIF